MAKEEVIRDKPIEAQHIFDPDEPSAASPPPSHSQGSLMVEQRFCKPLGVGSTPTLGSNTRGIYGT